jgi:hypothetical protein
MYQKFLWLFACALIACGGESYEDEELGTVEEAYNAPVTVNSQFGTQTGTSRDRCNRTSSGQVCSVPSYNDVIICYENANSFAAASVSRIGQLITALDGLLTTRTVGGAPIDIFGQPDCTQANTWIRKVGVGSSGAGSNDIANYSRPVFNFTTGLTENGLPGEPAVVGQYQKHAQCVIEVDENDILTKGTDANQERRYLDHAFVNAFAGCIGKGRVSGVSAFNRATQHDMSSTHNNDTFTTGELCQMNSWNNVNNGNFANAGNCGND